jgi:hypothetical protein
LTLEKLSDVMSPMRDTRERTFFWLGVLVLPIFWSWFTLDPRFNRAQRLLAFSWLTVTVVMAYACRGVLSEHLAFAVLGYPVIAGYLTVALTGWLLYRAGALTSVTLFEVLFLGVIFGPYLRYFMDPYVHVVGHPNAIYTWVLPLILSVAHLLLDPLTLAWEQLSSPS